MEGEIVFVPRAVAERANAFVMGQPDYRNPKFTPGVGWVARESGNIVRFVSSTPEKPGKRIGTVGQAYLEAKAAKRDARIARQKARAEKPRAKRWAQAKADRRAQQAAAAMARIAMAGRK